MKVIIAPDSFKESLSAPLVAEAMAEGVLAVWPDATIDICPMADGGEGTVEAMVVATGGEFVTADVFDPLGAPIRARYGLLGSTAQASLPGEIGLMGAKLASEGEGGHASGRTAVIEMAAASGLGLVPTDKRDPRLTTTYGTGQLILDALEHGATNLIIGIGGSATTDGGAGCAQALGVMFIGEDGEATVCGLAGGGLNLVDRIDMSGADPRLAGATIHVACDVTNPLTGEEGAAAVYGPQKGATPEAVEELDRNLCHLAHLIRRDLGIDVERLPGAGAAGGLGAGLVAFTGAKLERGVHMISDALNLPARMKDADLCITGEGKLDSQSMKGKTAFGVAEVAREVDVPVLCVAGGIEPHESHAIFAGTRALVEGDVTVAQAMAQPAPLLKERVAQALRDFAANA
jgi:glycerate kinase